MSDEAFTWMDEQPPPSRPRSRSTDSDTMAELRARISELQSRLDALESGLSSTPHDGWYAPPSYAPHDGWDLVERLLPAPGAQVLRAWRRAGPTTSKRQTVLRLIDFAGAQLTDRPRASTRWVGSKMRAMARAIAERTA